MSDANTHHVGDSIIYTLTVTNASGGDSVAVGTPITVTDVLPGGLLNVSATAAGGWSFSLRPSFLVATYTGPYPVATGTVLPAITITATVAATAPATLGNAAFVTSSGNQNLSDTAAAVTVSVLPAVGPTVALANSIDPSIWFDDTACQVTIYGSGFTGATRVMFGTKPATRFTVNSDTQITAVSPGTVADATVDVTVTTPSGTSAINPGDRFTYARLLNNPAFTLGAGGGGLQVGQTGTLIARVTTGPGPVTDPGSISFNATLPAGLAGISAVGTGWAVSPLGTSRTGQTTLTATYNGPYPVAPGTTLPDLDIGVTPTSAAGSSVTVSANAAAPISIDAFPQHFSFPVSSSTSPPPPDLTVSYPIFAYPPWGGPYYVVGGQAGFNFTVSNLDTAGPVTTPNSVTLTAYLPAGLAGVTAGGTSWAVDRSSSTNGATMVTLTYTGPYPIAPGGRLPDVTLTGTLTTAAVGTYTAVATVSTPGDTDPQNDTVANTVSVLLSAIRVTTTLTSSPNPSADGQPVTFTAAAVAGPAIPGVFSVSTIITTGTISFYDGSTLLGTAPLNQQGQATFTTATLVAGTHTITATYIPDPSTMLTTSSASITQVVRSLPPSVLAVGAGPGQGGTVNVYDASGKLQFTLQPFGPGFTGGVSVAVGDGTGSGHPDIIVGAGAGGGPVVAVFDGVTGAEIERFFAFDPSFRGGVNVATGDVTGHGHPDIIVGAGAGGGPVVAVFDGVTGAAVERFFAFDPSFRGGVSVAVGDVTGSGHAEIVVGAGTGGGPVVAVFDGATGQAVSSFFAFDPTFRGGVNVAAVDLAGTGRAEIVAAPGVGGGPVIKAFEVSPTGAVTLRSQTMVYAPSFRGGLAVGLGTASNVLAVGPASGPGAIEEFTGMNLSPRPGLGSIPTPRGGVFVG